MKIHSSGESPEAQNLRERRCFFAIEATKYSIPGLIRETSTKYENYTNNIERYSTAGKKRVTLLEQGGQRTELTGIATKTSLRSRQHFRESAARNPANVIHPRRVTKKGG